MPFSNCNHRLVYLRKWHIQKEIDITNFISLSDNIDANLNFRSKVVSIETKQICWKIFSLAVDKRTKNNLCMHWVSVFIIYSSIENFASIELTFAFDRMNFRSKQPSIKLTRYHSPFYGYCSPYWISLFRKGLWVEKGTFNCVWCSLVAMWSFADWGDFNQYCRVRRYI